MAKIQLGKCPECWVETTLWIIKTFWKCLVCKNKEPVIEEVKVIKSKEVKSKQNVEVTDWDMINWLPLYTSYYLNHKLHINLNSIKKQTCCILYQWKYILHKDIINQFKEGLGIKCD